MNIGRQPLKPKAQTAAELYGKGISKAAIQKRLGVSHAGFAKWMKRSDFLALVEEHRKAHAAKLFKQEQARILRKQSQEIRKAHQRGKERMAQVDEQDEALT